MENITMEDEQLSITDKASVFNCLLQQGSSIHCTGKENFHTCIIQDLTRNKLFQDNCLQILSLMHARGQETACQLANKSIYRLEKIKKEIATVRSQSCWSHHQAICSPGSPRSEAAARAQAGGVRGEGRVWAPQRLLPSFPCWWQQHCQEKQQMQTPCCRAAACWQKERAVVSDNTPGPNSPVLWSQSLSVDFSGCWLKPEMKIHAESSEAAI